MYHLALLLLLLVVVVGVLGMCVCLPPRELRTIILYWWWVRCCHTHMGWLAVMLVGTLV